MMSAASTQMDTFFVSEVSVVPGNGTYLALLTLRDIGLIIVDTET